MNAMNRSESEMTPSLASGILLGALGLVAMIAVVVFTMVWSAGFLQIGDAFDRQEAGVDLRTLLHRATLLPGTGILPWLLTAAGAGAAWALWFASVIGLGSLFVLRMLPPQARPAEFFAASFAGGVVLYGLAALAAGMLRAFTPTMLIALLVPGLAMFGAKWRVFARLAHAFPVPFRRGGVAVIPRNILGLVIALPIAALLLYAITPPIQSDAMRYHLGAPQEWLKNGMIAHLPLNAFSAFPAVVQMHYAAALAVGRPEVAHLIHLTFLLMTLVLLRGAIARLVEPLESCQGTATIGALCVYVTAPAVLVVAAWPFNDHAVCFFSAGAIIACLSAWRSRLPEPYLLAGVYAGGALGTKYSAALFVVAAWLAFMFVAAAIRERRPIRLKGLALAAVLAFVLGGPWYYRNFIAHGNPVYPMGTSVVPSPEWSPDNQSFYMSKIREKGLQPKPVLLTVSPIHATFRWTKYEGQFLGPALLLALFGGLMGAGAAVCAHGRAALPIAAAAVAALAWYAMWFFTYQSNRMLGPAIALLVPGIAYSLCICRRHVLGVYVFALVGIIVAVLYSGAWTMQWALVKATPSPVPLLVEAENTDEYLDKALSYHEAFTYLNERAATGQRVLLIGEHRIFYAKFDAVWSDWFDTPAVLYLIRENRVLTGKRLIEVLRREEIAFVLHNRAELAPQEAAYWWPRFTPREREVLEEALSLLQTGKIVTGSGAEILIVPPAPPPAP